MFCLSLLSRRGRAQPSLDHCFHGVRQFSHTQCLPVKRWTQAERDELKKLVDEGEDHKTISKALGRPVRTIEVLCRRRQHGENIDLPSTSRPWTKEDAERLRHLRAEGWEWPNIASKLGRTVDAVRERIKPQRKRRDYRPNIRPWGQSDIDELRDMTSDGATLETVSETLNRSYGSVVAEWRKLRSKPGVSRRSRPLYTLEEDQELSRLVEKGWSWKRISHEFDKRSPRALSAHWNQLEAKKIMVSSGPNTVKHRKRWSDEDIAMLRDLMVDESSLARVAIRLGRTLPAIWEKRRFLGLDKEH